jgi:hypothetical protein
MSECQSTVVLRPARLAKIGLTPLAESRLRRTLRRKVPSEPWLEAQFRSVLSRNARGEEVVQRLHDASVFPPGGAKTAMIRCACCGIFTPSSAFEHDICLDHADHSAWGRSPSAIAIEALQYRNLRLAETPLPPESRSALRAEIQRFKCGTGKDRSGKSAQKRTGG